MREGLKTPREEEQGHDEADDVEAEDGEVAALFVLSDVASGVAGAVTV
ncbi:hypothetical protein [Rhodococcus aetherivorans]|nr:hypothetical protein [Rhodococcus aetherivorans]UGQ39599.1 hypothetical protein LRQ66_15505 [Rhodococcus aetherivorans]